MLEKYKHIIWDWNGTLLNDVDLCLDIINEILVNRDLEALSLSDYRRIFTFPVESYYKEAGLDFNKESFEVLGQIWIAEYEKRKSESILFPHAKEILESFKFSGMEQSILSAYSHNTLLEIIANFKIDDYFDHILGLNHIYATSKVELGKDLISRLEYDSSEVLLIGDTIHDYEVACEIGADCFLIAEGHQNKKRLLECGVPVFDNLKQLIEI